MVTAGVCATDQLDSSEMADAESAVAYLRAVVPVMRELCVTEYAGLILAPDAFPKDATPARDTASTNVTPAQSPRGRLVPRVVPTNQ